MKQHLKSVVFISFLLLSGIIAQSHCAAIEGGRREGKGWEGMGREGLSFLRGLYFEGFF